MHAQCHMQWLLTQIATVVTHLFRGPSRHCIASKKVGGRKVLSVSLLPKLYHILMAVQLVNDKNREELYNLI